MKKINKILGLLLTAALLAGLCACGGTEKEPQAESGEENKIEQQLPKGSITLPIAHNDTLDPFKNISSVNRSLVTLLYDSLVYIDEDFQPQPLLAENYSLNGTQLSVTLKSASFSDGSAVTAQDVIYSFEQAKKSDYYSPRLKGFDSAQGSGKSLVFSLKKADAFAVSSLDFPIVKSDTVQAQGEKTELYKIIPPTGSGRYILNGSLPNATLVLNQSNSRNANTEIATINLFEINDSDGIAYGLQIGNYDCWYNDLSGGEYFRVNAGLSVVPTNSLVYLGFNSDKKIFQNPNIRRAVSTLISREEIVSQGFQGHAAAAWLPFNPAWSAMDVIASNGSAASNKDLALQLLESEGYTSVNTYGYRCSNALSLNCTLTVCGGNSFKTAAAEQIKEQLATLNFNVKIIELEYKDYIKAVAEGNYDMYLGEIKIPANMSLDEFLTSGGAANLNVYREDEEGSQEVSACFDAYAKLKKGEYSLSDFCMLFETEMPFVPVCYRNGAQVYSRRFKSEVKGTCYDNFYNINTWKVESNDKSEGKK